MDGLGNPLAPAGFLHLQEPRKERKEARMRTFIVFLVFMAATSLGCAGSSESTEADLELRGIIEARGLTLDTAVGLELPSIQDPLAVLGRKLFFSKSLGGDRDSACVTCHHPSLGGGDDLPLSIGVGAPEPDLLGPGRTHPDEEFTVPRNAPSTFNIGLFQRRLFWDGRVELLPDGIRTPDAEFGTPDVLAGESILQAQARFPVTSVEEMRGFEFVQDGDNDALRMALETRLVDDGRWAAEFEAVFGSPDIGYGRIASALAAYEQSQVFTDTPWSAYVEGDNDALTEQAKRGALLFFRRIADGGANCASCHAGAFFTDESFWAIGAPQIGRGKGDGPTGTEDFGRERETGSESDRYTFRTPSLLNVGATGPFFHSGAYETLSEVITHHMNPLQMLRNYEPVEGASLEGFEENRSAMLEFLPTSSRTIPFIREPFEHDEQDVADLAAFLEALTDPCVQDRACLSPWIADPETDDVDGTLLVGFDEDGDLL